VQLSKRIVQRRTVQSALPDLVHHALERFRNTTRSDLAGLEESRETLGKSDIDSRGGNAGGNAGGNSLAELAEIWPSLDADCRAAILKSARLAALSNRA
jgi:hypothetical protein